MPQNRKRVAQSGAKSIGIRTKHKIGGRKQSRGTNIMSGAEIEKAMANCRKRDRNKLTRAIVARGLTVG